MSSRLAEMAPEPVPANAPRRESARPRRLEDQRPVAADEAQKYAEGFPDLFYAATEGRPSFKQLVQAWRLSQRPQRDGDALAGNWLMPRLRERFAKEHGGIEKDYYGTHAVAGCLLASDRTLHSILNTARPALATAEIDCKIMAREALLGFTGSRLRLQLEEATDHAYSALTRVLGAADRAANEQLAEEDKDRAIASAAVEVKAAKQRIDVLLQRQSRYEYFQGVLWGSLPAFALAALIGVAAERWWRGSVSPSPLVGAITMAALGAVISVVQRMSTGSLVVDHTVSARQRRMLGSLRPTVGAVFGAVAYLTLLTGGLATGATSAKGTESFAFFALAGFAAGFSERFATDMLERSGQLLGGNATSLGAEAGSHVTRN